MHMSKVRTTINLNEDAVKKAKKLGIIVIDISSFSITKRDLTGKA